MHRNTQSPGFLCKETHRRGTDTPSDHSDSGHLFGNREALMEYMNQDNDDTVMDEADFDRRLRDEQVREIMYRISQCDSAAAFQALDPQLRKEYVVKMYQSGVSLSQIARFTGMPKTTIFRVVQASKAEEAENEKEYDVLRESDLADCFLYDGIVW